MSKPLSVLYNKSHVEFELFACAVGGGPPGESLGPSLGLQLRPPAGRPPGASSSFLACLELSGWFEMELSASAPCWQAPWRFELVSGLLGAFRVVRNGIVRFGKTMVEMRVRAL